jgi:lipocalin
MNYPYRSFKRTAKNVDLSRFVGSWYEIARLPFQIESRDNFDVTAEYTLNGSEIIVKNTESVRFPNGEVRKISATAHAKSRDINEHIKQKYINSQLIVLFDFKCAQPGEFNILFVGGSKNPDPYKYTVIGTNKHLWILCRNKQVPDSSLETIKNYISKTYD